MRKEKVEIRFSDDKAMFDWLMSAKVEDLKAKYPPPRYSARVDVERREVYVTDKGEAHGAG